MTRRNNFDIIHSSFFSDMVINDGNSYARYDGLQNDSSGGWCDLRDRRHVVGHV